MPADPLAGVPRLRGTPVAPGDRWVYSAGFNVPPGGRETGRIDAELADLDHLAGRGARVAVLSHQGSARDGTAGSLEFAAGHLARRLGRPVAYVPVSAGSEAERRARELTPGAVAVFGNTRLHPGEEAGDPALARAFARLGDAVAVGGFSKAHRSHASNVGILRSLPGVACESLLREPALLAPWADRDPGRFSVAALGGTKIEKLAVGLPAALAAYDAVVPGGAVLAALLAAAGHEVGGSALGADPAAAVAAARRALAGPYRERLVLPEELVVTGPGGRGAARTVPVGTPLGAADLIVDAPPSPALRAVLDRLVRARGRGYVAGPPGWARHGHRRTADPLLAALAAPGVAGLLLGGDTVAELPWAGPTSTGGGASLHYLAHGTCPVLDALAAQRHRTPAEETRP